ncbi:MAG: response regulator [Lachnospiraceae bacterium]|jgi:two-component system chemotaxis response regulator CheY|nr:response regulator [Lachnospiraceae bacterium]
MRILIAEDDFASRKFMQKYLSKYGDCDITIDGEEAVEAFKMAIEDDMPYDLFCLDIMMPAMDGYQVLKVVRELEKEHNRVGDQAVKIVMTTALNAERNINAAFEMGCTVYCAKPIDLEKFEDVLKKIGITAEA